MPTPKTGAPGTTDQLPRWEGPEETRPRGYLPAEDDPEVDRDAAGENLNDPDRATLGDAFVTRDDEGDRPVLEPSAPTYAAPPKDTEYEGHPEFSQDAAGNKPPEGIGNSEPVDDVDEKTRHSEGVNPAHPSPQQQSGAGPALAKHTKDA